MVEREETRKKRRREKRTEKRAKNSTLSKLQIRSTPLENECEMGHVRKRAANTCSELFPYTIHPVDSLIQLYVVHTVYVCLGTYVFSLSKSKGNCVLGGKARCGVLSKSEWRRRLLQNDFLPLRIYDEYRRNRIYEFEN